MSDRPKVPKELDAIADVVLAYKPKPKSKPGKKRKKLAKKLAKISREGTRREDSL
jgi:hypothetical protein